MSISLKDASVWKDGAPWIKDGGVWKPADKAWVKDDGVWKEIYSGKPPPFNLSGTFATDPDGWTGTGTWSNGDSRTAPGSVLLGSSQYVEYAIPKEVCGGLTISASIWHKTTGSGTKIRSLRYKIGAGSWVTLATATNNSNTYAKFTGSFDNVGNDDVTIRVESSGSAAVDDWAISGA